MQTMRTAPATLAAKVLAAKKGLPGGRICGSQSPLPAATASAKPWLLPYANNDLPRTALPAPVTLEAVGQPRLSAARHRVLLTFGLVAYVPAAMRRRIHCAAELFALRHAETPNLATPEHVVLPIDYGMPKPAC